MQSLELHTEAATEKLLENKGLGSRIKRLRLKRSMGLVELGQAAGLSASYLSQLETRRVIPTIRNLMRLGMVHKVDIAYFFREKIETKFQISKAADRINLSFGSKSKPFMMSERMATLIPDLRIVPCIAELRPGLPDARFEGKPFVGLDFAYVIWGSIRLSNAQNTAILNEADVAWIDGSVNRSYQCVGGETAKILIISFPYR